MRLRAWPALGVVLAAGLLAAQPAVAAAQAAVKFYADSGDPCGRGVTEGTLDWREGPVIRPIVQVEGTLVDDAGFSPCAKDELHSRATFSAYKSDLLVDTETVKADNGTVPLSFGLSDANGVTAMDRVVVRVCRFSNTPIGISYCGKAAEYKMP
ncbi:hypothetical protein ITP53_02525 [Nonomuraea sp. K274]|uniref:Uncharacterized protein n=1 Tax=Nonomuraea cypriaca TaxID=1187855 RepID=A0A931A5X2_9ACTN|nr:hypothetical protein [Nonomuraea cypriaca]MBF8184638.1 hypothetical protein [Nonomuraea cypriaca]